VQNVFDQVSDAQDKFTVRLEYVVVDNAASLDGVTATTGCNIVYEGVSGTAQTYVHTIKEPVLKLQKSVDASQAHDSGDTIMFGLNVTHQATSHASAYDLTVVETHDGHLAVDVNSIQCVPACDGSNITATYNCTR